MFNLDESQQKRVAKPPTHVDEEPHFFTKWKMIHNIELKNFEYSEDGKLYKDENDLYKEFTNLKEADKKDLFEFVSRRNK